MTQPAPKLERVLGLGQVTASGVGIIIGAGIYVLIGPATAMAGPRVWMAFLLAALLSVLTGLAYAELASMFPSAGAEFEYTSKAFPAWVAFLVGWVMVAGLVVAAAAVTLGFGRYLHYLVSIPPKLGAYLLLGLITTVALSGIRRSSWITVTLSLVQVGGLIAVVAIGIPHLGSADITSGGGEGFGSVVSAAALVFFAFIGFDEVITLAEETVDPRRNVPKALFLALGISSLLYAAVSIAAVSVLGAAKLGSSHQPLADVFAHAVGGLGGPALAVVALMATANTSLLCLTAASRLTYGMASQGALPGRLGAVSSRHHVPRAAIVLLAAVAALAIAVGNLQLVASVTDFAVYLVFIAVDVTVIVLRFTMPDARRPFRVPLSVGRIPVVPVLGLAAVGLVIPRLEVKALLVGLAVCLLGLTTYWALTRRGKP